MIHWWQGDEWGISLFSWAWLVVGGSTLVCNFFFVSSRVFCMPIFGGAWLVCCGFHCGSSFDGGFLSGASSLPWLLDLLWSFGEVGLPTPLIFLCIDGWVTNGFGPLVCSGILGLVGSNFFFYIFGPFFPSLIFFCFLGHSPLRVFWCLCFVLSRLFWY